MFNKELINTVQHSGIIRRVRTSRLGITTIKGIEGTPKKLKPFFRTTGS